MSRRSRAPERGSFCDRVRAVVDRRSKGAIPIQADVARELGCTKRWLQARLASEQTHFRQITRDAKRSQSITLLATDASVRHVASLLGYGNTSAFTRAFASWTGMTPSRWRQHHDSERALDKSCSFKDLP
jgi:AraC-like DNA-binding protein